MLIIQYIDSTITTFKENNKSIGWVYIDDSYSVGVEFVICTEIQWKQRSVIIV